MSTGLKITLIAFASFVTLIVGIVAFVAINYISAYNYANAKENEITTQYSQNQNKLSQLTNTVAGMVEVSEMAKDHIKEVTQAAIEGRYGNDGSKQVILAVQEAYPGTITPELYTRIMSAVESNRLAFADEQKKLLAIKQGYNTELGSFMRGKFINLAGYPKIDLTKYDIVISDVTRETFESGKDNFKIGK